MENIKPPHIKNIHSRKWLVPYMGDASYTACAALRYFGINARVMETNTPRGYELAKKHIQNEVCHPLRVVTGDVLSTLEEKNNKHGKEKTESDYFIAIPTAAGPCRLGKYQEIIRIFMDEEGYNNVPIGGPSSTKDYGDILNGEHTIKDKTKLQKMLLKGVGISDLLDDMTLRTRPYANDSKKVNKLKKEKLNELEKIIESGGSTNELVDWGYETVKDFKKHITTNKRFPLVVYSGEIYIRQHDSATNNIIETLEKNKLEVVRNPITEWMEYVNKTNQIDTLTNIKRAARHFNVPNMYQDSLKLIRQKIKGGYIHHLHEKMRKPFKEILQGRHTLPEPFEIIKTLEKENEYHSHIRGESALSIGIAHWIMNDLVQKDKHHINGMFHVGPFTCMQEGVATAKIEGMTKKLREKRPDLIFPVVHAYFGDSANPNLDSEIAVFREQCYQKRDLDTK